MTPPQHTITFDSPPLSQNEEQLTSSISTSFKPKISFMNNKLQMALALRKLKKEESMTNLLDKTKEKDTNLI